MTDVIPVKRALISVSDKTGLAELGAALAERGVEILSTGGSAEALRQAGIAVREVSAYTGFPEILDGRVKTLHPLIHGGILARRDLAAHMEAMRAHDISPIDLLVVNLYPFRAVLARGADEETLIENIDIGGPSLIRAGAKNHRFVTVLSDPDDYPEFLAAFRESGGTPLALRRRLAGRAFARTATYDAAIARWFTRDTSWPAELPLALEAPQVLRYGENPHQEAAFYRSADARPGVGTARQVQGKELSYNNINDTDAAYECVAEFGEPAAVIVKHANPCGVAVGATLLEAWQKALASDPQSAFGGIVAFNRRLDAETAAAVAEIFTEVIIAPEAEEEALAVLARKKNLRLLLAGSVPDPRRPGLVYRSVAGGMLVQSRDDRQVEREALRVVTKRAPDEAELADLLFAFRVVKHVKSNAVVFARNGATVGIGAGQMSRVDAVRIAAWKAAETARARGRSASPTEGAVLASDAFFPFPDGLEAAIAAGARAVIQPGGSLRDPDVIAAADAAGIAMVFTGIRHFRH
jgi:phosphoribosylaminoimidazolecarboxamide formyltransferase/IMP cyclohydrolase